MNVPTESLVSAFQRDGFVRIQSFFDPAETAQIEANLRRFVREIVPTLSKQEAMYEDYTRPETLKQVTRLEDDSFFGSLLKGKKLCGLAESLLRQEAVPQSIQFFNKPPGIGAATPPHQDGFYFCLVPNEALTIWVALDEVNEENGAMHYWNGSHKKGVFPHSTSHVLGFSQGLAGNREDELGIETVCTASPGDCLVHHSLTIHAAGPNLSKRTRRALGLVYYGENAKVDPAAWQRYQNSVEAQQQQIVNASK
ncbi:MAG TPA: phytanoyl-CoA dioxygenase family protein [Terriglobales bacterium]|nr:phytanoyl-CoA dioxygenase family protein [Terriglobales bacterium]